MLTKRMMRGALPTIGWMMLLHNHLDVLRVLFVRWHYATAALFVVASPPPPRHRLLAASSPFSFVDVEVVGERGPRVKN